MNFQVEEEQFQLARAIDHFSPGLERNLGNALKNLAILNAGASSRQEQLCGALQHEVRALHLSLGLTDASHNAEIVLNNLHDQHGAARFARIVFLLKPESSEVQKEYLKALVFDGRIPDAIETAAGTPNGKNDLVAVMEDVASDKTSRPMAIELARQSLVRWSRDPRILGAAKIFIQDNK
jgi:hypothetical protein